MPTIVTPLGEFTPQQTTDDLRKKEVLPVQYHASGMVRNLPLEEQVEVSTPAGKLPAELVTFHAGGELNRVFPLNGKLSGYWGQEDEAGLSEAVDLETPVGSITARVISVGFFESGAVRSITLWPGETVEVPTPAGRITARSGISFYASGALRSLEPAVPVAVPTAVGEVRAHDPDAVGVCGDISSLVFSEEGEVTGVTTTLTRISVAAPGGTESTFAPGYRDSLCGDEEKEVQPMALEFEPGAVVVRMDPTKPGLRIPLAGHCFQAQPHLPQIARPMGDLRCSI